MKFSTDHGPVEIEPQGIVQCTPLMGSARTMVEYNDGDNNLHRIVLNEHPNDIQLSMMASYNGG